MTSYLRWVIFQIRGKWPKRTASKLRRGPERDAFYRVWIRSLGCISCASQFLWQRTPTDCAHIGPHAMSQKASDYSTVPLCRECHCLLGNSGRAAFEKLTGLDLEAEAARLKERWDRELERNWEAMHGC